MISTAIQQLVNYGLDTGLILPDDAIYIRNQLLMTMQLDSFTEPEGEVCYKDLESILKTLVDDAVSRGVCADTSTARDLFDTKLMGVLTPRPSIVRANFEERYEIPASKLVLELGYSIDYEDEKATFEPDEADTVELINGERMPWEQVKRDGIDYIALYYVNEKGKPVQILDAELA